MFSSQEKHQKKKENIAVDNIKNTNYRMKYQQKVKNY